ncbi:hypothetical protein SAMN03159341_10520 [Paenibacillus sp. 1_12]|uniref:hypothetical protein n=1 Tax=Paenibacillus sp. 1_12 TaxID=1566278 RepID=UPI0008E96D52|nr:hypothetical protein [Paenibacillus sp. 1_12]SFL31279.1 hypothetical protein SAMN03159341_10520 [Paenibacillus sp. 1_12]
MWESVLKKQKWELQVNSERKSIAFNISKNEADENVTVRLDQSELFELMHTFLSINRSFNQESMYFEEMDREESAS